jgi:hypothetical protein
MAHLSGASPKSSVRPAVYKYATANSNADVDIEKTTQRSRGSVPAFANSGSSRIIID